MLIKAIPLPLPAGGTRLRFSFCPLPSTPVRQLLSDAEEWSTASA